MIIMLLLIDGVDSVGNLGIGTIDPNTLLDVRGDASFNDSVDMGGTLKVTGWIKSGLWYRYSIIFWKSSNRKIWKFYKLCFIRPYRL